VFQVSTFGCVGALTSVAAVFSNEGVNIQEIVGQEVCPHEEGLIQVGFVSDEETKDILVRKIKRLTKFVSIKEEEISQDKPSALSICINNVNLNLKEYSMCNFNHFGVPVKVKQDNETYFADLKVFATDPQNHPYKIEYLRFEEGSPMHKDIINNPHAAFMVDDLKAAIEGKNVIVEPFDVTENLQIAFINDQGAIIELMQNK